MPLPDKVVLPFTVPLAVANQRRARARSTVLVGATRRPS
jgi:hypothetical protein